MFLDNEKMDMGAHWLRRGDQRRMGVAGLGTAFNCPRFGSIANNNTHFMGATAVA